tara:strand:- start:2086 stop:2472 length:387 start_codon:yes stop_codon:yes gene_type:complete
MAAFIGRKATLAWKAVTLAGVREKSAAINGEPIDVSDGASDGWREVMTEEGESTVEISVSGVVKDSVLLVDSLATDRTGAMTLTYLDGGILSGTFFLSSYTQGNPYKDAGTFEATFVSSGAVTFTPAP